MGPAHITPGWFVLDKHIEVRQDGGILIEQATREALDQVTDQFSAALSQRRPLRAAA